jgi:hypothetical protein
MRSEAVEQFVESLRKRIHEEKLKQDVERTFLEEAINVLVDFFNSNLGPSVKGVKNYRTKEMSSYIDVEVEDPKKFKTIIKGTLRKIDSNVKWFDLGDLTVFSLNLKELKIISGIQENPVLLEIYLTSTRIMRIRVSIANKNKNCGRMHRKSMKWVTWIWDGKLKKIVLDRIDPFGDTITFYGEHEGNTYEVETDLDDSGFNYEIISIRKV